MEQSYNPNSNSSFGGVSPVGPPPKNWLVESILVTIFCCLPFGIVGIIKASEVNNKVAVGDYAGAQEASLAAGKWTKIGFFTSIALYVISGVLMLLGVGAAVMQGITGAH